MNRFRKNISRFLDHKLDPNKVNRHISAIIEKHFPTEILGAKLRGLIRWEVTRCRQPSHGICVQFFPLPLSHRVSPRHIGVDIDVTHFYLAPQKTLMPRSRERQKQIAMAEAEAVGMPGEAMNVPWAAKTLKKITEKNPTKKRDVNGM